MTKESRPNETPTYVKAVETRQQDNQMIQQEPEPSPEIMVTENNWKTMRDEPYELEITKLHRTWVCDEQIGYDETRTSISNALKHLRDKVAMAKTITWNDL